MSGGLGRRLGRQLSYANVMSALAVFIVLAGGTALAVGMPKNSVGSKTVRDNSLRSADLADGKGVGGADVADGSLTGADLADGALGGAQVADGSIGGADLADGSLGAAKLAPGAVGPEQLAPNSVTGPSVVDGSLLGADVAAETLIGRSVNESTLGQVPSAAALNGFPAASFLSGADFLNGTFPEEVGIPLGDGTFKITQDCSPNNAVVLSGGPRDLNPTTTLVESFPKNNTWTVRINPHGIQDKFGVRVLCLLQIF